MADADSRVTIHMAASLDAFIARADGSVDWIDVADEFAVGEMMDPEFIKPFLKTADCVVTSTSPQPSSSRGTTYPPEY
jgi:hypothetical protein